MTNIQNVPTLKEWADLPPAGDASLAGELAHGRLQEEHGDPTAHEEDDVRHEEGTFTSPQHNNTRVSTIHFQRSTVNNLLGFWLFHPPKDQPVRERLSPVPRFSGTAYPDI